MKVSVNWLKEYTNIDLPVDKLVTKIGAQLGGVDEVIDLGKKYQGIVVAKVISCEKHPNADKLKICSIDDDGKAKNVERNKNGFVQVVCGAPNVAKGMLVAWLPPGTTIPATYNKDPLVLEAREIRGQASNGMLASPSELSLSDDHSGILVIIDEKAKPGDDFAQLYGLDDHIIDIENKMFTHRPDLFGTLGIAREIAGIQQKPFKSPDWYLGKKTTGEHEEDKNLLSVRNELPKLVPRFMAQVVQNVSVGPSPLWLQIYLTKIGMKPINNIVDITNYMMHLTSQPMHAYDYDKVKARSNNEPALVIRYPKKGEKIKLLNGKEIVPRPEAIMIATDKELIGIGGVMGGTDTEVDENTTSIILECANFDMYSIRRTSMAHGLFTDAVTRFTKGQSPLQNDRVLAYAIDQIIHETGGQPARTSYDLKDDIRTPIAVHATTEFINSRLGIELDTKEIAKLLTNVEFDVAINGPNLVVTVPFWRTDIEISEDIVEEIGRLYGYDHLPLDFPKRNIVPVGPDNLLVFKHQLREQLAKFGANEVQNYSFVHGNLLERTGQDKDLAFKITNALSPDLQYYRLSLTPSLLDKVHMNIKAGYSELALFEIGKTHLKFELDEDGLPREFERLAFVYGADSKMNKKGAAYYQAKEYLAQLTNLETISFNAKLLKKYQALQQMIAPYDPVRSALIWNGTMPVGIVGEFKSEISRKLKLPAQSAGFEIFMSALQKFPAALSYKSLSKFPSISQDMCLQVSNDVTYGELSKAFDEVLKNSLGEHEAVDWQPIDIYTSEELKGQKRITYHVTMTSDVRTLTDDVLSAVLDTVAAKLEKLHSAKRI